MASFYLLRHSPSIIQLPVPWYQFSSIQDLILINGRSIIISGPESNDTACAYSSDVLPNLVILST